MSPKCDALPLRHVFKVALVRACWFFVVSSRPLLDSSGRAVLLCHTPKREYLRKLMHEPLPIESHLDHVMAEHMNAEVSCVAPPAHQQRNSAPFELRCCASSTSREACYSIGWTNTVVRVAVLPGSSTPYPALDHNRVARAPHGRHVSAPSFRDTSLSHRRQVASRSLSTIYTSRPGCYCVLLYAVAVGFGNREGRGGEGRGGGEGG